MFSFAKYFQKVYCCRCIKMHLFVGKWSTKMVAYFLVKGDPFILINPFPHITILQQTTLNIFCQKIENLINWMDNLWLKVENIVAKGEIARFEKFLLLSLCFQKGKGLSEISISLKRFLFYENFYLAWNSFLWISANQWRLEQKMWNNYLSRLVSYWCRKPIHGPKLLKKTLNYANEISKTKQTWTQLN